MSVGGIVIGVSEVTNHMLVTVQDTTYRDKTSLKVEKDFDINFGDTLWWQSSSAYWTPANKTQKDVRIKRIGGSFFAEGYN